MGNKIKMPSDIKYYQKKLLTKLLILGTLGISPTFYIHSDQSFSVEIIQEAHARKRNYSYRKTSNETTSNTKKKKEPQYLIPSVEFIGMKAPSTIEQQNKIYSEAQIKMTFPDGSVKTNPLIYNTLMTTGQKINTLTVGGVYNVKGEALIDESKRNSSEIYSNVPSSFSLLYFPSITAKTEKGGFPLYLINQYYDVSYNQNGDKISNTQPMVMSVSLVNQNLASPTGELSVQNYRNIDLQEVRGIWKPAGSTQTPWFTHLGAEHQEPDAKLVEQGTLKLTSMNNYFSKNYLPKVYHYGYVPEVMLALDGTNKIVKHYTLGRFSHKQARVMPDRKTVYLTDDSPYGGLFMFVADKAKDLSSGTLYGAKWTQVSNENNGIARITWIKLGSANSKEIEELANSLKFSQIFSESKSEAPDFKKIKSHDTVEFLKINPNMEKAGAFLETRRYASLLGVTTEFNHLSNLSYNHRDNKLYVSVTSIDNGMTQNANDPADDIQVKALKSGGIYEMSLSKNLVDSKNERINSDFVVTTMRGFLFGEDLTQADSAGNLANVEKVANPEHIVYAERLKTLFIAESNINKLHKNAYVWAYHIDSKKLSRIVSIPSESNLSSIKSFEHYNNFNYLGFTTSNAKQGEIGYLSGLPVYTKINN